MNHATRYRLLQDRYDGTWGRLQPKIVSRDHGRCLVPGCGSVDELHVHHVRYWRSRWLWMRAGGLLAGAGWLGWSGDLVGAGKAGLIGVAAGWWVSHDSPAWLVTLCSAHHTASGGVHRLTDGTWLARRSDPLGIRLRWRTWQIVGWRVTLRLRGTHWAGACVVAWWIGRRIS